MVYAILYAITHICFVYSIQHTSVANTLVLIAAAPIFAAIFSVFILKEIPNFFTWIIILIAYDYFCLVRLVRKSQCETRIFWTKEVSDAVAARRVAPSWKCCSCILQFVKMSTERDWAHRATATCHVT